MCQPEPEDDGFLSSVRILHTEPADEAGPLPQFFSDLREKEPFLQELCPCFFRKLAAVIYAKGHEGIFIPCSLYKPVCKFQPFCAGGVKNKLLAGKYFREAGDQLQNIFLPEILEDPRNDEDCGARPVFDFPCPVQRKHISADEFFPRVFSIYFPAGIYDLRQIHLIKKSPPGSRSFRQPEIGALQTGAQGNHMAGRIPFYKIGDHLIHNDITGCRGEIRIFERTLLRMAGQVFLNFQRLPVIEKIRKLPGNMDPRQKGNKNSIGNAFKIFHFPFAPGECISSFFIYFIILSNPG